MLHGTTSYMVLHVTWYYMLYGTTCYFVPHLTWYYMLHGTTCYMVLHVTYKCSVSRIDLNLSVELMLFHLWNKILHVTLLYMLLCTHFENFFRNRLFKLIVQQIKLFFQK